MKRDLSKVMCIGMTRKCARIWAVCPNMGMQPVVKRDVHIKKESCVRKETNL